MKIALFIIVYVCLAIALRIKFLRLKRAKPVKDVKIVKQDKPKPVYTMQIKKIDCEIKNLKPILEKWDKFQSMSKDNVYEDNYEYLDAAAKIEKLQNERSRLIYLENKV